MMMHRNQLLQRWAQQQNYSAASHSFQMEAGGLQIMLVQSPSVDNSWLQHRRLSYVSHLKGLEGKPSVKKCACKPAHKNSYEQLLQSNRVTEEQI